MERQIDPFDHVIASLEKKLNVEPSEKTFGQNGDGLYRLTIPEIGVVFEIDRLRRESHKLIGELCVKCSLGGARTYDGSLSIADFDLSSARARSERAKLLSVRSNANELDWMGYVEEFSQRVLSAERKGQNAIDLRQLERPDPNDTLKVEGLIFPRRHPTIIFGDGGAAKSYISLYLGGKLSQDGMSIALFDWELAGEDHRDRLERIFGVAMPRIVYARCEHALVWEVDRLRRIVRDEHINYAIFDSIAFACDGPPESAEAASKYFRALRQIGCGSVHIAHVTKGEGGDQKPFGSAFWHNGARATWYAKLAEGCDARNMSLGLFNRKANLGCLQKPQGFKICFTEDRTYFAREDPGDVPALAEKMTIRDRMKKLLIYGAVSISELADTLSVQDKSIYKVIRENNNTFVLLDGGKAGLIRT